MNRDPQAMRRYWPLLALNASPNHRLSPVQMQKTLFLLGTNLPDDIDTNAFYHFTPYHYGPFDKAIYGDLNGLIEDGFVDRVTHLNRQDFVLTDAGKVFAQHVSQNDDESLRRAISYLETVTAWVKSLSFEDLIKSIYKAYPAFKTNSIFEPK